MTQKAIAQKRLAQTWIALSLALVTELAIGLGWVTSVQAQFKLPNRGAPKTTAGGATRSGSCISEKTPLTVLVPSTKLGLTTEARPTFFLYLPKTKAQSAEFTLKDSNEEDVYRTMIPLSSKTGVVSFQLPANAPELKLDTNYQWFFSIVCQPSDRLRDSFAAAWIQRIAPDKSLVTALKQATPRQRPNVYAQAGIWQDTLATLAELRRVRPTDSTLAIEWERLLKSVGLGEIPASQSVGQLSLKSSKPQ